MTKRKAAAMLHNNNNNNKDSISMPFNSEATENNGSTTNTPGEDAYAGLIKDADKFKLMLLAWNYQNSAAGKSQNGAEGPDLATMTNLWQQYQNALAMTGKGANFSGQLQPAAAERQSSPIEQQQDETNSSEQKDEDDLSEDDSEDRLEASVNDPERLKAFNMFVRLFVDENLDRIVPISKQPKEKIQAIIDSCTRQFPEFAERARKRIRTYLKSCRRNKKTREGWENTVIPPNAGAPDVGAGGTDTGRGVREREPQRKAHADRAGADQPDGQSAGGDVGGIAQHGTDHVPESGEPRTRINVGFDHQKRTDDERTEDLPRAQHPDAGHEPDEAEHSECQRQLHTHHPDDGANHLQLPRLQYRLLEPLAALPELHELGQQQQHEQRRCHHQHDHVRRRHCCPDRSLDEAADPGAQAEQRGNHGRQAARHGLPGVGGLPDAQRRRAREPPAAAAVRPTIGRSHDPLADCTRRYEKYLCIST